MAQHTVHILSNHLHAQMALYIVILLKDHLHVQMASYTEHIRQIICTLLYTQTHNVITT